jgi:shikimate kinase
MNNLLKGVNLYLIGMMGAGKTTVGKLLAHELGYGFLDTDAVIEQLTGQSINQIFAEAGEAAFREIETKVLAEVAACTRLAIATGGGIVLARHNWSYLRHGVIVWLDAPAEELANRLQQDTTRPLLQTDNLLNKLETLLEQRQSLYAQADLHITLAPGETPTQIAERILSDLPTVLRPERIAPSTAEQN